MITPKLQQLTQLIHTGRIDFFSAISSRRSKVKAGLIFAFSDALTMLVSVLLSLLIRNLIFPESPSDIDNVYLLLLAVGIVPLMFSVLGIYPGYGNDVVSEIRTTTLTLTAVWGGLAGASFIIRSGSDTSRILFALSWLLAVVTLPLGRSLVRSIFSSKPWWGLPVMIIGAGHTGAGLIKSLIDSPRIGLKPFIAVDDDADRWGYCANVPVVGGLELIPQFSEYFKIKYSIVAMPGVNSKKRHEIVNRYSKFFEHVMVIPEIVAGSGLWTANRNLGGLFAFELNNSIQRKFAQVFKRFFDIVSVLLIGTLALPLIVCLLALVMIDSKGRPFFRQERMGKGDSRFKIIKFRTMHHDAEDRLDALLNAHPELRREYEVFHKLADDPRQTILGKFLRKYSLDELPQLWNVLKGDMSMIGPRAYIPYEKPDMLGQEDAVLNVKPGLSGLWQVTCRNSSFEERIHIDLYYIANWSVFMDLYIFARTISVVLLGMGA